MSPTLRFIPAMYAAALSGRKTQTRRVITPQPIGKGWEAGVPNCEGFTPYRTVEMPSGPNCGSFLSEDCLLKKATYGPPGTILPIVTTWAIAREWDSLQPCIMDPEVITDEHPIWFNDGTEKPAWAGKSRPAMFFPKSLYPLARQARVTAVKAERVQSISEADSIAEGIETKPSERWEGATVFRDYSPVEKGDDIEWFQRARDSYRTLWDSINATRGHGAQKGQYAWKNNPWVFATTFELV